MSGNRSLKIVGIFIAVIVIGRLLLPLFVLHLANKNLSSIPGYYGHIADIDLHIIRGAYKIDSLYLDKRDSVTLLQIHTSPYTSHR